MKKLIFLVGAALSIVVWVSAVTADTAAPGKTVTEPSSTVPQTPRSGVVSDYYISFHDSNGNCSTIIMSAKSPVEALTAAQMFCTDCLVMDVTDNFNKSPALARQTERYCPIR